MTVTMTIEQAMQILVESGIKKTKLNALIRTETKKTKNNTSEEKIIDILNNEVTKLRDIRCSKRIENEIDKIIQDQQDNPHQYTYKELCNELGKGKKLSSKNFKNLKESIKKNKKDHKTMISAIKKCKGTDKILKLQQLIALATDSIIHIKHCESILSSVLFGYRASEYSYDYAQDYNYAS